MPTDPSPEDDDEIFRQPKGWSWLDTIAILLLIGFALFFLIMNKLHPA